MEADPALARVIEFTDTRGRVLHRVRIPASYWRRVAAYRSEHGDVGPVNWEGGLEKDPHIWVYTEEFANKYHLPASGISGEMEGAMAMAFKMDSSGTESCGFFGDPKACVPEYSQFWSVYLSSDAKLYYTDESMDNFYMGYSSSNVYLRDKLRAQIKDNYPRVVEVKGLKCGAHIYRLWKKRKFGFLGKKEKTRWFGGPIWNHSYLQPRALGTDFTFVEHVDTIDELGCDQYFVFDDNTIPLRNLYRTNYCKARIPTPFMREVQGYISRFTASHRTLLDDFYDVLEGKSVEGRK
ncbi:hypothetical protein ACLG6S_17670 [Thermodesulfobacteriota bacterium B35]